jgi:hypothetical protein
MNQTNQPSLTRRVGGDRPGAHDEAVGSVLSMSGLEMSLEGAWGHTAATREPNSAERGA